MQWWEDRCQGCAEPPVVRPEEAPLSDINARLAQPPPLPAGQASGVPTATVPRITPFETAHLQPRPPSQPRATVAFPKPDFAVGDGQSNWGRLILEWELTGSEVNLGSTPDCQISLAALSHVGHLLTLYVREGAPFVEPSPSGSRVLLNGRRVVGSTPLRDGDKLGVNGLIFRFERTSSR